MTEQQTLINSVAPLANVARLTELITRTASRAEGLPGMGCFYGRAGLGKTTAGVYAVNKFNACHVEALPIGGVKGLLNMIVTELGLKPRRTTEDLFKQAVQELLLTRRPLIIDEADHILRDKPIEIVRRLHDMTGVPVILMGEEEMPQKLQMWDRVHSRMLSWVGVEPATIEDARHLSAIYARGVTIDPSLLKGLLIASGGSLRNVSTNLAHVREYALVHGLRTITEGDWNLRAFHTGMAPAPRHIAPRRRGVAA